MGFGGGISGAGEAGAHITGSVDASLEANLPALVDDALYIISVAGNFQLSALISPASSYFNVGDMLLGDTTLGKWRYIDAANKVDDTIYSRAAWDGSTHLSPSQNAVSDILATTFTAAGLTSAGTLSAFTDGYLSAATNLKDAAVTMSGVASAIQAEVDAIETAVGLTSTGTLSSFSGTNYINAMTNLKAAIVELDSKIMTEAIAYSIALGD
jgi:hypothetical protein